MNTMLEQELAHLLLVRAACRDELQRAERAFIDTRTLKRLEEAHDLYYWEKVYTNKIDALEYKLKGERGGTVD